MLQKQYLSILVFGLLGYGIICGGLIVYGKFNTNVSVLQKAGLISKDQAFAIAVKAYNSQYPPITEKRATLLQEKNDLEFRIDENTLQNMSLSNRIRFNGDSFVWHVELIEHSYRVHDYYIYAKNGTIFWQ